MASDQVETLRPLEGTPKVPILPRGGAPGEPSGWWSRYALSLERLPLDTRTVVEADARYVADAIAPEGASENWWPAGRIRTGIVVGAVQSGKTASMLAVSALLLDRGIGIVVILSGTRVPLWLQTYERVLDNLDRSTAETAWRRDEVRAIVPSPEDVLNSSGRADPRAYLRSHRRSVEKLVEAGRPVIFVVPKEDDHLLELGNFLSTVLSGSRLARRASHLQMVVLDDEADDASILDSSEGGKVTPRYIQQLWSDRNAPGVTGDARLYATYVAYTATPQANYLQATHNPLAPRDFQVVLRTPSDHGKLVPRGLTYTEHKGVRAYYCGGRMFYERLAGGTGDLCVSMAVSRQPGEDDLDYEYRFWKARWSMLGEALRAYFVSGAIRLFLSSTRLSSLEGVATMPAEEFRRILPPPHTMLFHPSSRTQDHFSGADEIVRWSTGASEDEQSTTGESYDARPLDRDGLARRLSNEEPLWRAWVDRFEASVRELQLLPGADYESPKRIPWESIRELLVSEVFPHTKLRVINSDPRAAERPSFEARPDAITGELIPPQEIFSIFVAGNVMSRGLTLEGLCTSLFLRSADEPAADTQMQMQRWFGYRGAHLPFCRVFLFEDQLELFRRYHANDEALRQEIVLRMSAQDRPPNERALVLEGWAFRATGKVDTRKLPLHPGPTPSVKIVEHDVSDLVMSNMDVVATCLSSGDWEPLDVPAGHQRGLIRTEPMEMTTVAEILEGLRYHQHDPDPDDDFNLRWKVLAQQLGCSAPLFRPPGLGGRRTVAEPRSCPYSIAAYLRLWDASLGRRELPGLYPTDAPGMPWHMVDLDAFRRARPRFFVAIRYGDEGGALDARLAQKGVTSMRRGLDGSQISRLDTLWGSRGTEGTYLGDQLLDYHFHGTESPPRLHQDLLWRPRGHPGLVLFHIVRHPTKPVDMVAVGLAIPHGGPDHIAALRGSRRAG